MRVKLENATGGVIHEQEVIFAGKLPEVIRWGNQIFAHRFTHWPHGITAYRALVVYDMPAELPPSVTQ